MIVGILAFIYIGTNPKMVIIGGTDGSGVGPGFFPFVCGAALLLLGLLLVINGIRRKGTVDYFKLTPEKKKNFITVGLLALFILVYLVLWKITKLFFVILPVYSFVVNLLFKRSILFSLIFTAVITAFVYFLFRVGFTIRFMP